MFKVFSFRSVSHCSNADFSPFFLCVFSCYHQKAKAGQALPKLSSQYPPVWCLLLWLSKSRLCFTLDEERQSWGSAAELFMEAELLSLRGWGFSPTLSIAGLVWGNFIPPGAGMGPGAPDRGVRAGGKAAGPAGCSPSPQGRQGLGKGEPVDESWAVEAPGVSPAPSGDWWGTETALSVCVCVSPPVLQP